MTASSLVLTLDILLLVRIFNFIHSQYVVQSVIVHLKDVYSTYS